MDSMAQIIIIPIDSWLSYKFLAVDTDADVWGKLLTEAGIKYKSVGKFIHPEHDYRVVMFKVSSRYEEKIMALCDMVKARFFLLGVNKYLDWCADVFELLSDN